MSWSKILPLLAVPVILNNTPLVIFWTIGRLEILHRLFERVLVPPKVRAEFLAIERESREDALRAAGWIEVVSLRDPRRALAYTGLDEGEAEVLALAEELNLTIVMDERKGRRYAQRMGLPLTGSLGVLLLAKERGLLESVRVVLDQLAEAGFYIEEQLRSEVLRLAGEAD